MCHIEDAVARQIDDGLRDDLAVAHHHHRLSLQFRQLRHNLGPLDSLGLKHRQAMRQRGFLDRGRREKLGAAFRTVGLSNDSENGVAGFENLLERRNGKRGSAEKNHAHGSSPVAKSTFDF